MEMLSYKSFHEAKASSIACEQFMAVFC